MPLRIPTDLATVLRAIATQLQQLWTPHSIVTTLRSDESVVKGATGTRFVLLRPSSTFNIDQGIEAGGGGVTLNAEGLVEVAIFNRYNQDQQSSDFLWLTDEANGGLAAFAWTIARLDMFDPLDGNNNWILTQPLRPTSFQVVPRVGPALDKFTWGKVSVLFDVRYTLTTGNFAVAPNTTYLIESIDGGGAGSTFLTYSGGAFVNGSAVVISGLTGPQAVYNGRFTVSNFTPGTPNSFRLAGLQFPSIIVGPDDGGEVAMPPLG